MDITTILFPGMKLSPCPRVFPRGAVLSIGRKVLRRKKPTKADYQSNSFEHHKDPRILRDVALTSKNTRRFFSSSLAFSRSCNYIRLQISPRRGDCYANGGTYKRKFISYISEIFSQRAPHYYHSASFLLKFLHIAVVIIHFLIQLKNQY